MIFLFSDEWGFHFRDMPNWTAAERYAEDMGWELLGEHVCSVDEETGEETYIQ